MPRRGSAPGRQPGAEGGEGYVEPGTCDPATDPNCGEGAHDGGETGDGPSPEGEDTGCYPNC